MPDPTLQAELKRLTNELEQARVAAEDAREEALALAQERDELRAELNRQRRGQDAAERAAADLREQLDTTARWLLLRGQVHQTSVPATQEELRVTVEELQAVTEELEYTNHELRRLNEELDRRVAKRTEELASANAQLEALNAELNERVQAEVARREEAQAQLFQAQKLEALGQLTGGLAHDFNNLLTVILSGVSLLARSNDSERRNELMKRVQEAAWRGADLTRSLLTLARRQHLSPQPIDLATHVAGSEGLLRHVLGGSTTIAPAFEPGLWPVSADPTALSIALLNLAVNARDAMPKGGVLTIRGRNLSLGPAKAAALDLTPGDFVELSVEDAGTGMPPEILARVFEPFFTTKGIGEGTGLGLAQVYGFAKQSGGTAHIRSALGEGTTVSLCLPRSFRQPEPQPAFAAGPPRGHEASLASTSILVVEDDPEVGALAVDLLAQLGHSAFRVGTAAAALGALTGGRHVDLVFTDVMLPGGMSGFDLARELAVRYPELPVVLTSGYGMAGVTKLCATPAAVLRKPYTLEALQAVLAQSARPVIPVATGARWLEADSGCQFASELGSRSSESLNRALRTKDPRAG
ncbi:MAG: response regulator [Acetobacteraceae bacterium]|nr:response regulator [Acetobacteraceae bacterium]